MPCTLLAFTSDGSAGSEPTRPTPAERVVPDTRHRALSSLAVGERALVSGVADPAAARVERLLALGISAGAVVTMLQTFPGVVFLCDQTELAVERAVADAILVRPMEEPR